MTVALLSVINRDIIMTPSGPRFPSTRISAGDLGTFNRVSAKMSREGQPVMALFLRPVGHSDNRAYNAFGQVEAEISDPRDAVFQPVSDKCETQSLWQQLLTSPEFDRACILVENRLLHLDTPTEPSVRPPSRSRL
jgi:hypothetical protein